MKNDKSSIKYKKYLRDIKIEKIKIFFIQIFLLVFLLGIWEILANNNVISTFLFSII